MATARWGGNPNVPILAGVLSALSLAVVFGAVLGYLPAWLLPEHDGLIRVIPHVNVLISLAAISAILIGIRAIRRGDVSRHRRAMLAATALFACFLVLYLYRLILAGTTPFAGPSVIRQFVYLPFLFVHVLFAIVCLPFVYAGLLLGLTTPADRLPDTAHARIGRIAAILWIGSFAMGIGVFLMVQVLF